MERLQLWWDQPGPSNVIGKIVQGVAERQRVLCVATPEPRPAGLCSAIVQKLNADLSLECAALDVATKDQTQPIPHLLAGLLNVSAVEIGSVSDFASHPGFVDQVLIVDGIDRRHLRRWSLFLRQLFSERAGEAVVGPVVIALLPVGLTRDEAAELCGPAKVISTQGMVDRYDSTSYVAGIGGRPAQDLVSRVGHAVAIDVAAWSREMLERIIVWEAADQIDPFALLDRTADNSSFGFPCWENGLVDYWDDEPAAHAVAAVKHGLREHVRRRIWSAQASVLLPFTHRILRSLIARYQHVLAKKVSPRNPLRKTYGDREVVITDHWKLEFYDFKELTQHLLSPEESELTRIAAWTRNKVAHRDVIKPEQISQFSDHYEANRDSLAGDIPGWNWPRCGQTMILTIGPSGAGKSTWSAEQGIEVVSSDEIRKEISPDGDVPGNQSIIFHRVRSGSARVIATGRDVIVDAMHVEAEHRLRQLSIAPPDIGVRYVIIDRPLSEKRRDAGWRSGRGIIEKYDREFSVQVPAALEGDGRKEIQVVDLRSEARSGPAKS
jgi:predicted kinase